jgi:hypothetical protein
METNGLIEYAIVVYIVKVRNKYAYDLCIGECPSNSPFLKNNGAEGPKGTKPHR